MKNLVVIFPPYSVSSMIASVANSVLPMCLNFQCDESVKEMFKTILDDAFPRSNSTFDVCQKAKVSVRVIVSIVGFSCGNRTLVVLVSAKDVEAVHIWCRFFGNNAKNG